MEQANAIVARIAQWLGRDGLKPGDIAVLVAKTPKSYAYELLSEAMRNSVVKFVFADHGAVGGVLVDTVSRFKGLESHAVVLWVGDEVVDEERKETMYVGVTRAKSLLAVVGSNWALKKLRA
jgi:ATP-dependent exoDNAse (exonuclease V) beta subunit